MAETEEPDDQVNAEDIEENAEEDEDRTPLSERRVNEMLEKFKKKGKTLKRRFRRSPE